MLIVGHSKMIFTDRNVEKADVWNLFFAAVAYSTWQLLLRNQVPQAVQFCPTF